MENRLAVVRTHGESRPASVEYRTWRHMLERCLNPDHPNYRYYGGRGITVCQRWQKSFETFVADVGRRPTNNLSLDRINNDGNYEPGNVRWATRAEQTRNRRPRVRVA